MPNVEADAILETLLRTPEGRSDPYPLYHRLRAVSPVHRTGNGTWYLTRYADCAAALRDPRLGKDYPRQIEIRIGPEWRRHRSLVNGSRSMVNLDGTAHTRLRRLVVKAFTPKTVAALRPKIEAMVDALLDPVAEAGGGEIFEALGFPLPVGVIGELLGIPEDDRPRFRSLVRDQTAVFEPNLAEVIDAADRASAEIAGYFHGLLAAKRACPADDLLSRLATATDAEDGLSDDELVTLAGTLFGAGFETTTNLIGNGLLGLLDHPGEMERLRRDPSLLAGLSDELLRYDGTAQMTSRFTKADVEVSGVTIPAGSPVMIVLGAANRDPARYLDPDRVDVGRTSVEPLSFGGGVHYCIGAALAQAEIDVVFRKLLERFETIEVDGERPRFRSRLVLRGLEALHVAVKPAARSGVTRPRSDHLPLRPAPGLAGSDAVWRNAHRARVEADAAGVAPDPERLLETVVLLARAPLFRRCSAEELRSLAATAYPLSFAAGERLCVEGGESLECYVLAEGEATVTIGGRVVGSVREDDVVGERGPLEGRARSATVTADTHVNAVALSRERLLALAESSPQAKDGMFEYLRNRYREPGTTGHERGA